MKVSPCWNVPSLSSLIAYLGFRASVTIAMALLFTSATLLPAAQLIADDFNDGNDNGWSRYDPLGGLGVGPRATFTLVNGSYQIQALVSPNAAAAGPGRAGSYRSGVNFADFYVAVDILNWDEELNQAFGILARVQNVALGQTTGYAFTYDTGTANAGDLDISKITGEDPSGVVSAPGNVHLPKNAGYRFVFMGKGSALEGRVYSLTNLETPLYVVQGTDATYTQGQVGLVVFDNTSGTGSADATFDNFYASPAPPVRLEMTRTAEGDVQARWPSSATGWTLEQSTTLQPADWTAVSSSEILSEGGWFIYTPIDPASPQFFRLSQP